MYNRRRDARRRRLRNFFVGGEEQGWLDTAVAANTVCRDEVNAVPTDVNAVFTWKMCNKDAYPLYLDADSTYMKFEDVKLAIDDIATPIQPGDCREVEYPHVMDLCSVNPENGRRRFPFSVQM